MRDRRVRLHEIATANAACRAELIADLQAALAVANGDLQELNGQLASCTAREDRLSQVFNAAAAAMQQANANYGPGGDPWELNRLMKAEWVRGGKNCMIVRI